MRLQARAFVRGAQGGTLKRGLVSMLWVELGVNRLTVQCGWKTRVITDELGMSMVLFNRNSACWMHWQTSIQAWRGAS